MHLKCFPQFLSQLIYRLFLTEMRDSYNPLTFKNYCIYLSLKKTKHPENMRGALLSFSFFAIPVAGICIRTPDYCESGLLVLN
jgi:hypothetical protein